MYITANNWWLLLFVNSKFSAEIVPSLTGWQNFSQKKITGNAAAVILLSRFDCACLRYDFTCTYMCDVISEQFISSIHVHECCELAKQTSKTVHTHIHYIILTNRFNIAMCLFSN